MNAKRKLTIYCAPSMKKKLQALAKRRSGCSMDLFIEACFRMWKSTVTNWAVRPSTFSARPCPVCSAAICDCACLHLRGLPQRRRHFLAPAVRARLRRLLPMKLDTGRPGKAKSKRLPTPPSKPICAPSARNSTCSHIQFSSDRVIWSVNVLAKFDLSRFRCISY
jgi:hypothetical protein